MSFAQTAFKAISGGVQSLGQGSSGGVFSGISDALGGAAGIGSLVSATLGAVGALHEASAEAAAAKQDAALAARQAAISQQNARIIASQTSVQAAQADREKRLRLGAIRAKGGASGGAFGGSMLDVLTDVAAESELSRQTVIHQGQLAQRNELIDAESSRLEGALALQSAKSAKTSGTLAAANKLIGGGLGIADARSRLRLV